MCDTSNITVGTIVMVKVGRNEIEVVVTEITANGWKVKKVGSDREFIVTRIERVIERRKLLPQRNRKRKRKWTRPIPRRNPADRRRKSSHS